MTYSPFPEFELEALALEYDAAAKRFGDGTKFREFYTNRSAMLRNAILCQNALRERCLLAENDRNQLALKLEGKANAA